MVQLSKYELVKEVKICNILSVTGFMQQKI